MEKSRTGKIPHSEIIMRLSKTAFWASGILVMFLVLGIHRGLFLLKAKSATGEVIGSETYGSSRTGTTRSCHVQFMYEGRSYSFWTSHFSYASSYDEMPVIFNPDDPENAYENSFRGIWLGGLTWIGFIFIPWSAAALSIIGENERLVISWKKIGLEK